MNQLRQLLFPSDDRKFFRMLSDLSAQVSRGAAIFKDFVETYEKLSDQERGQRVADIKELEHRCDELSHIIIMRLNHSNTNVVHMQTIHAAASLLATIMDGVSDVSRRIVLFRLLKTTVEVQQFSLLVCNAAKESHALMQQLHAPVHINKTIIRIHGIEREADYVYHLAMADLFSVKQRDARELIILKDLYEAMENIVDNTESLARVVENMVAKDKE